MPMPEGERSTESPTEVLRKKIVEFIEQATDEADKSKRRIAVLEALTMIRAKVSYYALVDIYLNSDEDERWEVGETNVQTNLDRYRVIRIKNESKLRIAEYLVANQFASASQLTKSDPIMGQYYEIALTLFRTSKTGLKAMIGAFESVTGQKIIQGLSNDYPDLLI